METGLKSLRSSTLIDCPRRAGLLGAPTAAVGDDGLLRRTAQAVPQMPTVTDLHRLADRSGVGGGAVPAHDLDVGMLAQPRCEGGRFAVRQHVHAAVGDR